jgi:hypothetical protein
MARGLDVSKLTLLGITGRAMALGTIFDGERETGYYVGDEGNGGEGCAEDVVVVRSGAAGLNMSEYAEELSTS